MDLQGRTAPYRPVIDCERPGKRMSRRRRQAFLTKANRRWRNLADDPGCGVAEFLVDELKILYGKLLVIFGLVYGFMVWLAKSTWMRIEKILVFCSYGTVINGCDSKEHSLFCKSMPGFVPRVDFRLTRRRNVSKRRFLAKMRDGPILSPLAMGRCLYEMPRRGYFRHDSYRVRHIRFW